MVGLPSSRGMDDQPRRTLAVLIVASGLAGCLSASEETDDPAALLHASLPTFGAPVLLDAPAGATGLEPSILITPEGTILVCAPISVGKGSNLWRSTDGGATFDRVGVALHPALAPHRSLTGDGAGGDCHLGVDQAGIPYLVDGWVGSAAVSWTRDQGETWEGVPASQLSGTVDRPWILGGEAGEVFVTGVDVQGFTLEILAETYLGARNAPTTGGIWVARSTDGGRTFPQQVLAVDNADRFYPGSNLASGNGNLYLYYVTAAGEDKARHMVAVSKDRGLTWTHKVAAEVPYARDLCGTYPIAIFPVVAADDEGGVYLTASYANPETERWEVVFIASPDGGEHWNAPRLVADRPGTQYYPWIATAGNGRVGIAWYESNQTVFPDRTPDLASRLTCGSQGDDEASDWFVHYAESRDAASGNPTFVETLVQPTPVNRTTNLGRPFAEFLSLAFDTEGRAGIVYVCDTDGAPGRMMFALQSERPRPIE